MFQRVRNPPEVPAFYLAARGSQDGAKRHDLTDMTGGETVMSSGHGAAACVGGSKPERYHSLISFSGGTLFFSLIF
jgi:hypothetical protein